MRKGFRELKVWQRGYEMTLEIYQLTKKFPSSEQHGMISQMRRAATSVPANISEGYERNSKKEYLHFLNIARGSLSELETFMLLAKDLKYINEEQFSSVEEIRVETVKMLKGLIKSLN